MAGRNSLSDYEPGNTPEELEWIDRVTRLMDAKFRIPGTSFKFGLDPIIGLIPYVGEVITFGISGLIVLSMIRHGASGKLVSKMMLNVGLDAAAGIVPGVGDVFDLFYKANRRNYRLLREHQLDGKHKGTAWPLLIGVSLLLLIMLALMVWGMVAFARWIF